MRARILGSLALTLALSGCSLWDDESRWLVVATPWSPEARAKCETIAQINGSPRLIRWVELGAHRWADACDRRGGIDLILGGSPRQHLPLLDDGRLDPIALTDGVPWQFVDCPLVEAPTPRANFLGRGDPRDDPAAQAEACDLFDAKGWPNGYATLVHRPVGVAFKVDPPRFAATPRREVISLVRGGRHRDQAIALIAALTTALAIQPAPPDAEIDARTDDLLADLLGAALIDARAERRDAQEALEAAHHPALAEAALGESPPWPPASVARLRADPTRQALADALAEGLTPDGPTLDWLEYSWRRPKQAIDLPLLRVIAEAQDGRLARDSRFRAWLRGEWSAWTQQLDRRVARLATGYQPR